MYGSLQNPSRKKTFVAGFARIQPEPGSTGSRTGVAKAQEAAGRITFAPRRGFTLVEMLITITIIGILAGGVLAALQSARETAKVAKTKSTITKLHYIIMARYDSYRTRRVPIEIPSDTAPQFAAFDRLNALHDLMRMEMPDRWSDVDGAHGTSPPPADPASPAPETMLSGLTTVPSINARYFRLYRNARNAATASTGDARKGADLVDANAAAECLYMIVMSIPEASEQFQNTEIGDVDGDGLKEFVDGWGHAIRFIRWPVGFVDFERLELLRPDSTNCLLAVYHNRIGPAGAVGGPRLEWSSPSDLQSGDRQEQPDPFDSMGVGGGFSLCDGTPSGPGFAIFPLIYSAGQDGIYDINLGFQGGGVPFAYAAPLDYFRPDNNNGPDNESPSNTLRYIGQPLDGNAIDGSEPNDALNHYDNIHNHRLEVR